jgi:hypothetical protein
MLSVETPFFVCLFQQSPCLLGQGCVPGKMVAQGRPDGAVQPLHHGPAPLRCGLSLQAAERGLAKQQDWMFTGLRQGFRCRSRRQRFHGTGCRSTGRDPSQRTLPSTGKRIAFLRQRNGILSPASRSPWVGSQEHVQLDQCRRTPPRDLVDHADVIAGVVPASPHDRLPFAVFPKKPRPEIAGVARVLVLCPGRLFHGQAHLLAPARRRGMDGGGLSTFGA